MSGIQVPMSTEKKKSGDIEVLLNRNNFFCSRHLNESDKKEHHL
jgi:hypothetical protein